ncbi:MAG TPA: TlpA disulfide reductase family protein [Bryobacteraceae bacterium]|nr:TlpA disulfide reductase family protein [Bryobacteraceae bacterium]
MIRRFISVALLAALSTAAFAMPPLPRRSPEFTITQARGKDVLLSTYRGKVVALAFVFTTCIHCQVYSSMINAMQKDLGPRGFQAIDVAWNQDADRLVPNFVRQLGLTFPVGYSTWDPIMSFLGFSVMDRPVVPLIVVIDKKGMIRAESPPQGDPDLQDETKLRALVESLLNEGATAHARGRR